MSDHKLDNAVGLLQMIVDELYDLENSEGDFDFQHMIDNADEAGRIALSVGKLYQQVNNGGFCQWIGNGYAEETLDHLEHAFDAIGGGNVAAVRKLVSQATAHDVLESLEDWDDEDDYGRDVLDHCDAQFYNGIGRNLVVDCATHIVRNFILKGAN